MQFFNAIIAASILAFTSAAPVYTSSEFNYIPADNAIIPSVLSQYTVSTGAINFDASFGDISKDGVNSDITTLLTFDIPASLEGLTCSFHLVLDGTASVNGTGQFDIFTSQAPATQDTTSWPSGNLRDNYAGRMQAHVSAEAQYVDGFPNDAQSFPCPAGHLLAGELVGTGDFDFIFWDQNISGAYISYN
ncbi:hypothetical protein G7Y89_g7216 [Cudoniella acicularis]|uniref:Ubiquitin 3 binding protein But2 C-terminal domain-containing protein n=1 Tax=Cudoniella acicularis TaxID=354080 RepID=A0A8H4RL88_9HELO|nr:hypothetical protein G7Y89_g7216 [Cudoniella acicularis]